MSNVVSADFSRGTQLPSDDARLTLQQQEQVAIALTQYVYNQPIAMVEVVEPMELDEECIEALEHFCTFSLWVLRRHILPEAVLAIAYNTPKPVEKVNG